MQRPSITAPVDRFTIMLASNGAVLETKTSRSAVGAANAFVDAAFELISANGARDTAYGWQVHRRALRIARDISAGHVVAADLDAWSGRIVYSAPAA